MIVAVKGCKIVGDAYKTSGTVEVVEYCEKCGATGVSHGFPANNNGKSQFYCKNCGNHQYMEVKKV